MVVGQKERAIAGIEEHSDDLVPQYAIALHLVFVQFQENRGPDARQKITCTTQYLSFVPIDVDLDELRDQAMIRAVLVEAGHQQIDGLQAALFVSFQQKL